VTNANASDEMLAIDIQREILKAKTKSQIADAFIELKITLPNYPQIDPIIFEEEGRIPYTHTSNSLTIKGISIPTLLTEIEDIPDSYKPISIAISVASKSVVAKKTKNDKIQISPMNLKIAVYKKKKEDIDKSTKPSTEVVLKKVSLTMRSYSSKERTADLKFKHKLPETGDELFDSLLAGEEVVGEYYIEY